MRKRMSNSSYSSIFKRNASKTNRMNIVPPMYRGGIRL